MNKRVKDIRRKSVAELYKELKEAREKLLKLKFEVAQGKTKKTSSIQDTKRKIARILTIISEKQWEEFEKQSGAKNEK